MGIVLSIRLLLLLMLMAAIQLAHRIVTRRLMLISCVRVGVVLTVSLCGIMKAVGGWLARCSYRRRSPFHSQLLVTLWVLSISGRSTLARSLVFWV